MNKIDELPLVSIACITYNQEKYIHQCLDGFVMQKTNFKIEVVIHDDASTDNTPSIIREYCNNYPDLFVPILQTQNKYKEGKGILVPYVYPKCRGKYIALCEGDDYWTDPYKLQKQVDFLEANPEYSMCFHPIDMICLSNKKIYNPFVKLEQREYLKSEIISNWCVPTASVVFNSNLWQKIPQNPNFKVGDVVLFFTLANYGKIYCLKDTMAVYRRHQSGWTRQDPINTAFQLLIHFNAMKESFPGYDYIFNKHIIKCYRGLVLHNFIKGFKDYGFMFLWSFFKLPFEKLYQYFVR